MIIAIIINISKTIVNHNILLKKGHAAMQFEQSPPFSIQNL